MRQVSYRKIILICICSILFVYAAGFFILRQVDMRADLDGDVRFAFPVHQPDSVQYVLLARNMVERHVFSQRSSAPFSPDTFRTPGYPAFIAFFYSVFHHVNAVVFVQIILAGVAAFLLFRLGELLGFPGAGFLAALVFLVNPTTFFLSITLMSEVVFVVLVLYALVLWVRHANDLLVKHALGIGALLGCAVLVRPVAMFVPIIFVGWMVLFHLRILKSYRGSEFFSLRSPGRPQGLSLKKFTTPQLFKSVHGNFFRIFTFSLFFVTCVAGIVLLWVFRNYSVSGSWGISSLPAYNLLYYNVEDFLKIRGAIDAHGMIQQEVGNLTQDEAHSLQNSSLLMRTALGHIAHDPVRYALYHAAKTAPFFFGSGVKHFVYNQSESIREFFGVLPDASVDLGDALFRRDWNSFLNVFRHEWVFLLERLGWGIVFLLGAGAVVHEKQRRWELAFLWAIVLFFAISTGPVALVRYRFPAEGLLSLLGGIGLSHWIVRIRTRTSSGN